MKLIKRISILVIAAAVAVGAAVAGMQRTEAKANNKVVKLYYSFMTFLHHNRWL